jgi:site-specific DNA-methyltransferase (adenine-specific)
MKPITQNSLFYGDNLQILREYIPDESIDLIYLDPPFNSSRSYNVLFKDESGKEAESQITAFEDTWHWGEDAEKTYHDIINSASDNVCTMISAMRDFIGTNQMMAYITMMTARLLELHRVLRLTGSIYLHCDPTASHYLKVVMDVIFGAENFRNEINWKRTFAHGNTGKNYANVVDAIFFYVKSSSYTWNQPFIDLDEEYVEKFYRFTDPDGRRWRTVTLRNPAPRPNLQYLYTALNGITYRPHPNGWVWTQERMRKADEEGKLVYPSKPTGALMAKQYLDISKGVRLDNLWDDIPPIGALATERLGYPTQKPLPLLERIIQASSNEGDVVLDPFCGCGTAIAAAEKLKRKWIGIDITHLSISLMKYRLKDAFGLVEKKGYKVIGEPETIGGARQLAADDRYQFQWWALSLIQAKPLGGDSSAKEGKKGSDKGIDGVINFIDEKNRTQRAVIQVKSGHVKSGDIRDLRGVLDREAAAIGVFITLEEPSRDMITEAVSSGYYHSDLWQKDYPRIQILTIEELLKGKTIDMPKSVPSQTFKQAEKVKKRDATQNELFK